MHELRDYTEQLSTDEMKQSFKCNACVRQRSIYIVLL